MIKERWDNLHPMGRIGDPKEAAHLVLYLASCESSFTWVGLAKRVDRRQDKADVDFGRTGAEHVIDGGWLTTAGFMDNPFKKSSL